MITVEQLKKGCLCARRSFHPTESQLSFHAIEVIQVHQQILYPNAGAFAHGGQLCRSATRAKCNVCLTRRPDGECRVRMSGRGDHGETSLTFRRRRLPTFYLCARARQPHAIHTAYECSQASAHTHILGRIDLAVECIEQARRKIALPSDSRVPFRPRYLRYENVESISHNNQVLQDREIDLSIGRETCRRSRQRTALSPTKADVAPR